jgi:L-threonylcarbamoyladenylate synthase
MTARVWQIDPSAPIGASLEEAAALLRDGKLVAFPTETVYGLGANGLDPDAVRRIYEAKGRPPTNPVILHVSSIAQARSLSAEWPAEADTLANAFWPGPLTLIVPKASIVPDIVTAGRSGVALRQPSHPIAAALLEEAGIPVAAPSANPSGSVSPTNAAHVLKRLGSRIDGVIDGGPTDRGLESTVVDLTGGVPIIRRPGPIDRSAIEAILGVVELDASEHDASMSMASPGQMASHYAPRAKLHCVPHGMAVHGAKHLATKGESVICILREEAEDSSVRCIRMPPDAAAYARGLYGVLHDLDDLDVRHIVVEMPPKTDEWMAVRDRLLRAGAPR